MRGREVFFCFVLFFTGRVLGQHAPDAGLVSHSQTLSEKGESGTLHAHIRFTPTPHLGWGISQPRRLYYVTRKQLRVRRSVSNKE